MAREFGKEYPERKLMGVISDLLGIEHFSTARGSTVRKDFLQAIASAVGVPGWERLDKDPLLEAIIEHVTGQPMDPALFSPGTTVTDQALQTIINGIVENGFSVYVYDPLPDADAHAHAALTDVAILDMLDPDRTQPPDIRDQLVRSFREEHDTFRQLMLRAYEHRCALSGSDVVATLRAVHLIPRSEGGPDRSTNGLLLRSDLASLLDTGSMVFDEETYTVILHPQVKETYGYLEGRKLRDPAPGFGRPAEVALEWRRERADL